MQYPANLQSSPHCQVTESLMTRHFLILDLTLQDHFMSRINRVKHCGINATLTAVRERFWILRGRETVKQILRHCVVCCRYDAVPCKPSKFAALPSNRVSDDPPFSHIGLDFAGPLHVKDQLAGTENSS